MGLSIVERIANILDCELHLASTEGAGTVFSLFVPAVEFNALQQPRNDAVKSPQKSISGYNVLVIDNEQTIQEGMETLLNGWGCNVHIATGEDHAVDIIQSANKAVDIVLADFHLWDDKDGLDLIADVRHAAGYELPAVLITADRTREVQDRAEISNVIHMRKPVKPANLRASMARAMVSQHK